MLLSISLLQGFSGTQNVSSLQKDEAWRVNVQIQGIDHDHGYLCGTMEALNVPMADTPVRIFTVEIVIKIPLRLVIKIPLQSHIFFRLSFVCLE